MAFPFEEVTSWVIEPLRTAGISDYSYWWIDVPEFLRAPHELYARLGGSQTADAPEYQSIEPQLTEIFKQFRTTRDHPTASTTAMASLPTKVTDSVTAPNE